MPSAVYFPHRTDIGNKLQNIERVERILTINYEISNLIDKSIVLILLE